MPVLGNISICLYILELLFLELCIVLYLFYSYYKYINKLTSGYYQLGVCVHCPINAASVRLCRDKVQWYTQLSINS